MRQLMVLFFFSLLIVPFMNGCNTNEVIEEENLFQLKNSYVGDAGAVGKISRYLPNPNGEQVSGLELKTKEEPYGIILNYSNTDTIEDAETNYRELALNNATFILSLVKNADWVQFNFINEEFNVSREELQKFYGKDIREFNTEEELSRFIQKNFEDENRVIQFFN